MKERRAKTAEAGKANVTAKNRTGRKPAQAAQVAQADKIGLREIYKAIVDGFQLQGEKLDVIAARLESIRKTLWRMSDVRNYKGKGEDVKQGDGDAATSEAWNLLREFFTVAFKQFKADVANGRIDITGDGRPQGEGARHD